VAIILPWAIPIVIQGMLFYLLFNPSVGFLSGPLQSIGVFGANPLTDSTNAFIITTVADIWKTSAFMALLILAGMQSIDNSLYDVAEVAGASPWQRFRHITLPLILPALLVAMLFRTIDAMLYLLFNPSVGFLSGPLQSIGVFGANPLTDSTNAFIITTVADIWKTSAFMALLILAGMQSIDNSLYDVAEVAGASPWQRFRHITLPLILPALLVAMLFRTIDAMRVYGIIEASGAGCGTVPSLSCLVVDTMFGSTQAYASAATVAFITAIIIGIAISVYLLALKFSSGGTHQ